LEKTLFPSTTTSCYRWNINFYLYKWGLNVLSKLPYLTGGSVALLSSYGHYEFDNLLITSSKPIPEPTTMLVLASGLAGFMRKFRKR